MRKCFACKSEIEFGSGKRIVMETAKGSFQTYTFCDSKCVDSYYFRVALITIASVILCGGLIVWFVILR